MNQLKRWTGMILSACLILSLVVAGLQSKTVLADVSIDNEDESFERYIAFGQDLKGGDRETVLSLFGITESDVANYKTIEITNEQEHEYLGDYISSSVIGKRALSSVMIVKTTEGSGIKVTTDNINYCTSGMYTNALLTAGLKDATVKVAGPFSISGTSALVGAMKAYSVMTGEEISETTMDTATNELVATANLANVLDDPEKAEELIAAVKQTIVESGITDPEEIADAISSSARALDIDLTEEQIEEITDLMEKISKEDIPVDAIKEQAGKIYEKLQDVGIDFSNVDSKGLIEKVGDVFAKVFEAVANFFSSLFG